MPPRRTHRPGFNAVEAVVVIVIVLSVLLVFLLRIPRQREMARSLQCRSNLGRIGKALAQYDDMVGRLPRVPELGPVGAPAQPGPLAALIETLGLSDIADVELEKSARKPGEFIVPRVMSGLVCPSDPRATARAFLAPVSYRAVTGDQPEGRTGVFPPGRSHALSDIEAADGLAYTAAFGERLVGQGTPSATNMTSYAIVPGPVTAEGCSPTAEASWRDDAGQNWSVSDWTSSLANFTLVPNARPSCIASDGQTARMGASSGHVEGAHVLNCDGSVREVAPRINLSVWQALANIDDSAAARQTTEAHPPEPATP